jgi:hypothetical protein
VLVSHRRHALPLGRALLMLDRAIAPSFVLKRVALREVVQDERFTKPILGVDCARDRHRVVVVLQGTTREFAVGRETALSEGDAFFVPAGTTYASRAGDCDLLELEWDPPASPSRAPAPERLRLGARTRARVRDLARTLSAAEDAAAIAPGLEALLDALASEASVPVPPPGAARASAVAPGDQALVKQIDGSLGQLGNAPMLVDLESSLASARRTLTRRIRDLHERYALSGRGGGRWRGLRDTYRLVIASILLTHADATPRRVAGLVGYRSVEALDHAFRNASLASPAALQRAMRLAG